MESDSSVRDQRNRRAALALVVLALGYAAIDHGGFFRPGFRVVILLILLAGGLSLSTIPASVRDFSPPLLAISALTVWYVIAAVVAGDLTAAAPSIELLVAMAAVVVIVRRADGRERELLLAGLLLVGLVVALTGWVGLVWRRSPLAIEDTCCGGIWRAASSITYANAAAGFLTTCFLVALALLARTARPRLVSLTAYALLVGFVATFSRGGSLGLVVGLVVLVALDGWRVLARSWPVFVGAAVAGASLLPALKLTQSPHAVLAGAGLLAGAVIVLVPMRWSVVVVAVFVLGGLVAPGVRHSVGDNWRTIAEGRFTTTSPDRDQALDAAFRLARDHPVTGVGPGRVDLTWRWNLPGLPEEMHLPYAHNEYVQVLAEAGGVGFVILIVGLAATGVAVWRRRRGQDAVGAAGSIAALCALGLHSATDYLWHVPIIPLTGAVLVATVLPSVVQKRETSSAACA